MKPFNVQCINDCEYLTLTEDGTLKIEDKPSKGKLISLTVGNTYQVISIENGLYRVTDDTGADYLFPPNMFKRIA